jgi:hypothetical protein
VSPATASLSVLTESLFGELGPVWACGPCGQVPVCCIVVRAVARVSRMWFQGEAMALCVA